MRHSRYWHFGVVFAVTAVILVSGCIGSKPNSTSSQVNMEIIGATSPLAKAQNLVNETRTHLRDAESEGVQEYSQIYFPDAKREFADLEKFLNEFVPEKSGMFSSGYDFADIYKQSIEVEKLIDKARITKQLITQHLQKVIDDREYVASLDLNRFTKKFAERKEDINDLFRDVEQAQTFAGSEKQADRVLKNLHQFEVEVITAKYHEPLQQKLRKIDDGPIPITHKSARESLALLAKTIDTSTRDYALITAKQADAQKAVTKAENILKEVRWVDDNGEEEQIVLYFHKPVDQYLPGLVDEDMSELMFADQIREYASRVSGLRDSIQQSISRSDETTINQKAEQLAKAREEKLRQEYEQKISALQQKAKQSVMDANIETQKNIEQQMQQRVDSVAEEYQLKLDALTEKHQALQLEHEKVTLSLQQVQAQSGAAKSPNAKDSSGKQVSPPAGGFDFTIEEAN